MFVYNEGLLLQGNIFGIFSVIALLTITVILSGAGLTGYLFKDMGFVGRIVTILLAMLSAVACTLREMTHSPLFFIAALAILALLLFTLYRHNKQPEPATAGTS